VYQTLLTRFAWSGLSVLYLFSLPLLALLSRSALALDPTQPTANYLRTTFTVEDGLPDNVVNTILQSRDGFLWIGTYAGLVRFNGRDFMPIDFRMAGSVSQVVVALAEGPDGSLWVGTDLGIVRIHDVERYEPGGSTSQLYRIGKTKDEALSCLKFTQDGILFAGTERGLYRLNGASFMSVLPGINVQAIEEASKGHLLIIADNDFLEWDRGRIIKHPRLTAALAPNYSIADQGMPKDVFHYVMEDRSGAMWYCSHWGTARQGHNATYRYPPCASNDTRIPIQTYNYGQGTVWAVGDVGVFRTQRDSLEPLLTVAPRCILADRDGNLWIGTNGDGLIRFRDRPIRMLTTADGLPNNVPMTVLERHDGTIWVGNNCGGLSRFDGKRFVTYAEKDGLLNTCVWALAEDGNDDLWIGTWGGGAFRFKDGKFKQYAQEQGLPSNVVRSIVAAPDDSLWFATNEGLSRMCKGQLRNYTSADGLSSNHMIVVYADRHGGILAASSAGIDRMTGHRFVPLSSPRQIVDPHFIGFSETQFGQLYAFSAPRGISRIDGNRLVDIGPDLDLLGMAEFRGRELWFSGRNGILRVPAASGRLSWEDRSDPLEYAKFGRADGLNSTQCSIGAPNIIVDRENRLWVPTVQGLAMIDLLRLPQQRRPPAVFIEEVTVDRQTNPLPHRTVLAPGNHHLELKFDAIELTSPERVRFQYRLDGVDDTWLDAGTTRTAVYTSFPIGRHLFHVRACNSDGIWDRDGIAYGIIQEPFFYETNSFRLIAVVVLIVLGVGAFRLRVRQIAAAMHARFDERLAERTRIARELHDTLLQSFQGLLLRFQAVSNLLPHRPDEAKPRLEAAIDQASHAITEGRDAVRELRASTVPASDLDVAISTFGEELMAEHGVENVPRFHLQVEGMPRELQPILRDEVYRIGGEALRNAFRHGKARRIEAEIRYDKNQLRLRLRDDGKGIDAKLLNQDGEPGHWGLPGMRERAKLIGGKLDVWSELDSGTEVELRVPASLAYATSRSPRRRLLHSWLGRAFSRTARPGL
jgi:signal transduction histidine kinase/ligand-binding sensor domain-containing protein